MSPRRILAWAAVCLICLTSAPARGEEARSLPLSRQSVYNYFRQIEEARRAIDDDVKPEELQQQICRLYAAVLKKTGYDFEATVQNAVQFAEKGDRKLEDPRFLFLAAVFQIHPDIFLKYGLISQATHDAVVNYFGPQRTTSRPLEETPPKAPRP